MLSNPFPKKQENKCASFIYPIGEKIELNRHHLYEPLNLWDVLEKRKSTRTFRKLTLDELSSILWVSAKVKDIQVQDNGYILSHRPAASAGARHPVDILILSPHLDNLNFFYYYNPFEHSLNKLLLNLTLIEELKNHFISGFDVTNASIFWFIAHPVRTEAKYDNPISLIWRDAGALIHSIQIACTALDVNSCPLGTLGEPFISQMFSDYGHVISAGGVIIG